MATPPPLPANRSAQPVLPPPRRAIEHQFDLNQGSTRVSTRGVNRATGQSEGVWFSFNSTNVNRARVDPQYDLEGNKTGVGMITIEFVSGAVWEYSDRPMGDWYDLITSSSKGRKAYYDIRGPGPNVRGKSRWPGHEITPAWRSREQIKAIIADREPVRASHRRRTFRVGGKLHGAGGARIF